MPSKVSTNKLFSALANVTFDQVGQFNPQLLREWQGRLRWRNLLITGLLTFVIQAVLFLQRYTQLPTQYQGSHSYCLTTLTNGRCAVGASKQVLINWPFLWADVFHDLTWIIHEQSQRNQKKSLKRIRIRLSQNLLLSLCHDRVFQGTGFGFLSRAGAGG